MIRSIERIMYMVALPYYIIFLINVNQGPLLMSKLPLMGVIFVLAILSHYKEGFRLIQVPFYLGFIFHAVFSYIMTDLIIKILGVIGILLLLTTIILVCIYGDSDLERIKMTGPFEVGYREFRTSKLGNEVSVYYPVDRDHYKIMLKASANNNTDWLRYGDKTLLGLAKSSVPYGQDGMLPWFLFRPMKRIKIGALFNGKLAP